MEILQDFESNDGRTLTRRTDNELRNWSGTRPVCAPNASLTKIHVGDATWLCKQTAGSSIPRILTHLKSPSRHEPLDDRISFT
jgi:hypothetical protein